MQRAAHELGIAAKINAVPLPSAMADGELLGEDRVARTAVTSELL